MGAATTKSGLISPTLLLFLASLLLPAALRAATVYVDPSCANSGDGTQGEPCAASSGAGGPKNSWIGLVWTAGNTYAGQGGTSQTLSSYLVAGSGTAGNPIRITSYGTGRFKFRSDVSYSLATVSRSYITFDNLAFESPTGSCLYLTGVGSNIVVQNSAFTTCGAQTQAGVMIEGTSNTADLDNLSITGNTFTNLAGWAVKMNDVSVGNSAAWDRLTIADNVITNVGSGANTGAIGIFITAGSNATFTNLAITGNTIANVGDEESSPVHQIIAVRSINGTVNENRFLGGRIDDNRLSNGGGGIYINNWGSLAGARGSVSRNTITSVNATAGIISFYSSDVLVEANAISGVATYPAISNIDGIGIDLDLGNVGFHVRRNSITGCLGNAAVDNSGQGITIFGSSANYVYGNLLTKNQHGLVFGDDNASGAGVPNYVENNTLDSNLRDGVQTSFSVEQINVIANNIISNNGRYGISSIGSGNQTLFSNVLYANAAGNYNSQPAGATDILANPLFTTPTNYQIQLASPARQAGKAWTGCMDILGQACCQPPDVGAYQSNCSLPVGSMPPAAPRGLRPG